MANPRPKLCVSCKHHVMDVGSIYSTVEHICTFYETENIDLVTGEVIKLGRQGCYTMREKASECGREGKYWEPIEGGNYAASAQK